LLKLTDAEKDEKRSLEEVEMERLDHQQRKPKASTSSKVVRKLGMEQNISCNNYVATRCCFRFAVFVSVTMFVTQGYTGLEADKWRS